MIIIYEHVLLFGIYQSVLGIFGAFNLLIKPFANLSFQCSIHVLRTVAYSIAYIATLFCKLVQSAWVSLQCHLIIIIFFRIHGFISSPPGIKFIKFLKVRWWTFPQYNSIFFRSIDKNLKRDQSKLEQLLHDPSC